MNSELPRRCGLPGVSSVAFEAFQQSTSNVGLLFLDFPDLEPFENFLLIPGLLRHWVLPMTQFCSEHGTSSSEQYKQVQTLLRHCGWADQPEALRLVLDELQWNSLPVLRHALGLLRGLQDFVCENLIGVLRPVFGAVAVAPLRRLIDPKLTLAVVIGAPDNMAVRQAEERTS